MTTTIRKDELETRMKEENQLIRNGELREDHPLDLSAEFYEFMQACRRSDLKRCQELISSGVNINGKDQFDYTPLIIASLCGHYELVQLLLESGAVAHAGTWVGERTVYNALNDRIRNLLLSYDYSKTTNPLHLWVSHVASLLSRLVPKTSDIELIAGSENFHLHRFLLSSRSPYFRKKLADAPGMVSWRLPPKIPLEAFTFVVRYLYLGELPKDIVGPGSTASEANVFKGIDKLCKQLEIEDLWVSVLSADNRALARQRYKDEIARAQTQVGTSFHQTVLRHKMVIETDKVDKIRWSPDNAMFADCILRADEYDESDEDSNMTRLSGIPIGPQYWSQDSPAASIRKRSVLYPVHKSFLIRSRYFETMFSSSFMEAQKTEYLHIIKVDCLPEVLEIVLRYLYTEMAECPLELALDLLYVSDILFLDKLKGKAAQVISTLGSGNTNVPVDRTRPQRAGEIEEQALESEPINIYDVIHAAWDLKVQRLEDFAARYLADRLEDYVDEPEFSDLIQESASRIKARQETDTIELLDDIRYYLDERFRQRFEDAGLEDMLDETVALAAVAADDTVKTSGSTHAQQENAVEANDKETVEDKGAVMTLDGTLAEDEFAADAKNYQILLNKIDKMLGRLKLDA